jgi:hypothetical protein
VLDDLFDLFVVGEVDDVLMLTPGFLALDVSCSYRP